MQDKLKIIFMGTADFAVPQLFAIYEAGHHIAAVVTVPDKPAGRGLKLNESPVKKAALQLDLPILQPQNLSSSDFIDRIRQLDANLFVVVAFRMLPESVWKIPKYGTINLHASVLPQFRGAAPINWAVINGESRTGLTTFFINEKIDEGNIIDYVEVPIGDDETAGELHDKLVPFGQKLMLETIEKIVSGNYVCTKQNDMSVEGELKLAPKIFKNDCLIDWSKDGESIFNLVRGLSPYPAAFTHFMLINDDKIYSAKIYKVKFERENHDNFILGNLVTDNVNYIKIMVSNGWIFIEEMQLEGRKRMKVEEFLRGKSVKSLVFE
ncbi:MAG: methionyl-tRNA formyltransferase [Bacteroidales bacterium]